MTFPMRTAAAWLSALLSCGCAEDSPAESAAAAAGPRDGLPAACNPLRAEGACLLPFPSSIYLTPDGASPTGQRVALSADVFPRTSSGVAYEPVRMNLADGFSPSCEILAYFPERIDGSSLAPADEAEASLEPGSATVLVDMETGEPVAHFAEIDAQVMRDDERQVLILRPMARLSTSRRYAVGITTSLRTLDGAVPASPPGWAAIVGGTATDPLAVRQAGRMPEILAALEAAGTPASELLLAWDFETASDEGLTKTLRSMRAQTLAQLGETGLGYTIDSVEDDFSSTALRRVRGTFTVPKFLTEVDVAVADTSLSFDDEGNPVQDGTYQAPFTLLLPRSAESGPVRLLLFGHGFLGSGEGELGGDGGSYLQSFGDAKGYAIVATDWAGLSRYEGVDSKGSGAAAKAVEDANHIPWISDRLQQAIVAAMTLARTARGAIAKDPALFVGGEQVIDDSRIDFYGISLGGVMGSVLMGFSPDLERGVLNVGAAGWSTMFQRSTNWSLFKLFLDGAYRDKLDQQVVLEVMQAHFDPVDGLSIAPHMLADPLEGGPSKQILLQIAVNDTQVPNLASEMLARTMGLPMLDDSPKSVFGLEPTAGPLSSALTAWDVGAAAPPPGNAIDVTKQNEAHGAIRSLAALMEQTDVFLRSGEVVSTCEGVCDPE